MAIHHRCPQTHVLSIVNLHASRKWISVIRTANKNLYSASVLKARKCLHDGSTDFMELHILKKKTFKFI